MKINLANIMLSTKWVRQYVTLPILNPFCTWHVTLLKNSPPKCGETGACHVLFEWPQQINVVGESSKWVTIYQLFKKKKPNQVKLVQISDTFYYNEPSSSAAFREATLF